MTKPRIAVMKIGANITWSKSAMSASNFDITSICELLEPFYHICLISRKTRNTIVPKGDYFFKDIRDVKDINKGYFDHLLVFNGNVNFYGGQESVDQILIYKLINDFDGPVHYMQTDGQLFLKQIWPAIACKDWASNWKETDLTITRNDIHYISQGHNIEKTRKYIESKKGIRPYAITHFPLEQAILCGEHVTAKPPNWLAEYDLIYGGAPRSGARRKKLLNFYAHNNLKTYMFGAINRKNLQPPPGSLIVFGPKVQNNMFISELNRRARATVIIGDDLYDNNFNTLRMYESILAGLLVFIDNRFDPDHLFYKSQFHMTGFYVRNAEELYDSYRTYTDNESTFEDVIHYSRDRILNGFCKDEYVGNLVNALELFR